MLFLRKFGFVSRPCAVYNPFMIYYSQKETILEVVEIFGCAVLEGASVILAQIRDLR